MWDRIRLQLNKLQTGSIDALFAIQCTVESQVLSGLDIAGVASFARDLRRMRVGPHLAMLFNARARPHRDALIFGQERYTYRELDGRVNQLSRALVELGLSSRDPVAIMLPNCTEHMIVQETMPRIGGVGVQIACQLKADDIAHIFDNSDPQFLVYHYDYRHEVQQAIEQASYLDESQLLVVGTPEGAECLGTDYDKFVAVHSTLMPVLNAAGEGGTIVYTSGTTGQAKGAARSWQDTDILPAADLMRRAGMRSDERHLIVCPLYHSAAQAFTRMMTGIGASIVLATKFEAEAVLAIIEAERITSAFMVPTMLVRLNKLDASVRAKYDTSSLRWIMSGAAPLATATAIEFQDKFGPILHNFYGATEIGTVTHAGPDDHKERPGSVGKILRGNEIRILDEEEEELPTGEVGELYVRNGMIMVGYHKNPDATEKSQRDGFFSVGDFARVDSDGYLYLASRKHDMLISGGVNIYPREIEEVLHHHPMVVEVAVIGVPDQEWGESVRAYVVSRHQMPNNVLQAQLESYCKEHLANFKQPRSYVFLAELPRNATGKVLKRELRS